MTSIATLGPVDSYSYQAARLYSPDAEIICFNGVQELLSTSLQCD